MQRGQLRLYVSGAVLALLAAFAAAFLTQSAAFVRGLEVHAADLRVAAFQAPEPPSDRIVIAAITEDTVTQFPYRSPVDREFIANLLRELERKGVRAVGLDILFDQPTEAHKDEYLWETLREVSMPVFISYTNSPLFVNEDQLEYLHDFVPEHQRAAATLPTDPMDGTVRWIYPGETGGGMPMSFARRGAYYAGVETPAERVDIAWRARPAPDQQPFPTFPAHLVPFLPDAWFADRIVLVGATLSITDRHRTPLAIANFAASTEDGLVTDDAMMPGVLIMAHGMSQLIEGRTAPRITWTSSLLVSGLLAFIGVGIGLLRSGVVFKFLLGGLVIVGLWLVGILGYGNGPAQVWTRMADLLALDVENPIVFRLLEHYLPMLGLGSGMPMLPLVAPTLALALALWMMDVLIGRSERQQRQFVQGAFSRYVAPAVVERLVANPEALSLTGTRQEATFIFTDVAGFTTLSEGLPSEKLAEVLNSYLDGACGIILRYQGTVDKFIGDAIMAVFNAPIPQPDHADRAVRCALELDAYCEAFREQQNAAGIPLGITRIGLHTGVATIGNFGSQARMDFTALGDTVNTAARTEGVNKYFGTRICCTEEVVRRSSGQQFLPIGDVVLKGKHVGVTLYTPVNSEQAAAPFFTSYMEIYARLQQNAAMLLQAQTEAESDQHPKLFMEAEAYGSAETEAEAEARVDVKTQPNPKPQAEAKAGEKGEAEAGAEAGAGAGSEAGAGAGAGAGAIQHSRSKVNLEAEATVMDILGSGEVMTVEESGEELRLSLPDASAARDPTLAADILALAERYPQEPLARFHAQRVAQGLLTHRILMESK